MDLPVWLTTQIIIYFGDILDDVWINQNLQFKGTDLRGFSVITSNTVTFFITTLHKPWIPPIYQSLSHLEPLHEPYFYTAYMQLMPSSSKNIQILVHCYVFTLKMLSFIASNKIIVLNVQAILGTINWFFSVQKLIHLWLSLSKNLFFFWKNKKTFFSYNITKLGNFQTHTVIQPIMSCKPNASKSNAKTCRVINEYRFACYNTTFAKASSPWCHMNLAICCLLSKTAQTMSSW